MKRDGVVGWDGRRGMERVGMKWVGLGCDRMRWDGMEDGMGWGEVGWGKVGWSGLGWVK